MCLSGAARLWSVWQAEPARIGLETLQRGDAPAESPALLRDIADSLAASGRMGPYIVPWATSDRGGSLEALMRLRAGDPSAVTVLETALGAAPGDPNGWVWLARLRLKEGKPIEAGQALRVALLAGQVLPGAMLPRLRLGLDLYPLLDADTQRLVQRQIRLVWVLSPKEVPPLFSVSAYIPILTEALMAVTPSDEQQFRRVNRLDRTR
ncbi:MAG: tetratricopeptide repeat protein [Elstera sp.]